jgi:hypothetical protein
LYPGSEKAPDTKYSGGRMAQQLFLYAACGATGALIYSFPLYLKAISKDPPFKHAGLKTLFSIFVGATFALFFTGIIGQNFAWTIRPEPWPLALVIGLSSNRLVPIILKKIDGWAESFEGKS